MTNRMRNTEWTYHKGRSFANNYLYFLKVSVQSSSIRISYKLIWCTNYSNVHIHTFSKRGSFIWGLFFSMSILDHLKFYVRIVRHSDWIRRDTEYAGKYGPEKLPVRTLFAQFISPENIRERLYRKRPLTCNRVMLTVLIGNELVFLTCNSND